MDQYVDDTTLYTVGDNVKSIELVLSQEPNIFGNWCSKSKLINIVNKTKLSGPRVFMTSSYRPNSGGIKEI